MQEIESCIEVNGEKDIVKTRQLGRDLAKQLGFSSVDQVRMTAVVSELARNLILYANGGDMTVGTVEKMSHKGLMIMAKDHGPGIENIRRALEDGFTTSGGLGSGLPGVKRIMDDFTILSEVGEGTEIVAVKWVPRTR